MKVMHHDALKRRFESSDPVFLFLLLLFVLFFSPFLLSSYLNFCFLRKDARDKAVQDEEAERRRQVREQTNAGDR